MIIELSRVNIWATGAAGVQSDYEDADYSDLRDKTQTTEKPKHARGGKGAEALEAEEYFRVKTEQEANKLTTVEYPCDKKSDLYVINAAWVRGENSYSPEKKNSTIEVQ